MDFEYIPPEKLPEVWREIRQDVISCVEQDTDDCLIEDVYYFLKTNLASLHVCYVDSEYMGFAILQRVNDLYSGIPKIVMWLCHSKKREYTVKCFEIIKEQAKESGCNKVVFKNTNENFLKLTQLLGFKQGETEFICEI